jgi:hypothetical protein
MKQALAQRIAKLSEDIRQARILKELGHNCQHEVDRLHRQRDTLVKTSGFLAAIKQE